MAISGVKVKVYIVGENNEILGGQRGATLNRSAETLDSTTKESDGWQENEAGNKSWGIDADGIYVADNSAYTRLEEAYLNSSHIGVYLELPSGTKYVGRAIITDLPIEAPYDDLVTYSVTLTGSGSLTKTDATVVA